MEMMSVRHGAGQIGRQILDSYVDRARKQKRARLGSFVSGSEATPVAIG